MLILRNGRKKEKRERERKTKLIEVYDGASFGSRQTREQTKHTFAQIGRQTDTEGARQTQTDTDKKAATNTDTQTQRHTDTHNLRGNLEDMALTCNMPELMRRKTKSRENKKRWNLSERE